MEKNDLMMFSNFFDNDKIILVKSADKQKFCVDNIIVYRYIRTNQAMFKTSLTVKL